MLEVPIQGHHSTLSTSFQKRWEAWEELLTDDILDLYKVDGGWGGKKKWQMPGVMIFASENQWKFNDRCDGDPFTIRKVGIFDWNGHFQFSSFGVQ